MPCTLDKSDYVFTYDTSNSPECVYDFPRRRMSTSPEDRRTTSGYFVRTFSINGQTLGREEGEI